jgi:hypothetical protein
LTGKHPIQIIESTGPEFEVDWGIVKENETTTSHKVVVDGTEFFVGISAFKSERGSHLIMFPAVECLDPPEIAKQFKFRMEIFCQVERETTLVEGSVFYCVDEQVKKSDLLYGVVYLPVDFKYFDKSNITATFKIWKKMPAIIEYRDEDNK